MRAWWCFALIGGAAAAAYGAGGGQSRQAVYAEVREAAALGQRLFADPALSASGRVACASCHDPQAAFGPAGPEPVRLGGADLRRAGRRAVPSLRYLQAVPAFTEHYFESEDEGDPSVDNGPTGGLTWDGRVDRARDQARLPLLSPFEMANRSPAALAARVGIPFPRILAALEAFEQQSALFYPYSSKYDAYLAGKAELTAQEARGLAAFNDPARGNCAHCHFSARGLDGTPPQFTDYGFVALGVPRNPAIPANADPNYYDLGLCGPLRRDFLGRAEYCGLFRAPSLRNTARRRVFFHNGVFHSLAEVLDFYAERDTAPEKFYPRGEKFDDLPARYRGNVNSEPPFGGRPGEAPRLSPADRADIIAFLQTLNDGYYRPGTATGRER
jgi:cytochrome c peroxidase